MKKRTTTIIFAILFLAGLSLLLYPFIANEWNNYRQKRLISNYEEVVTEKEAAGEIAYEAEWEKARVYNDSLLPSVLPDSFAVAEASDEDEEYMSALNLAGDGIKGSLEGSSLPVGGESTHAVISAHRGLPSAALFTDLDKLVEGDHFLLHILDDTLCYEVDRITVVEPEETDTLAVVEGEDLVTLLTCTPYGVNSHRLLVRGHRVPYVPEEVEDESTSGISLHTSYLLWVVVGVAVTGVVVAVLYHREKKLRNAAVSAGPGSENLETVTINEPENPPKEQ